MTISQQTRQELYLAAVENLEQLQREMQEAKRSAEREAMEVQNRSGRKIQVLLAGGVLLSSLMSALATHAFLPPLHRSLSHEEKQAIENLCGYIAAKKAVSQDWVEEIVLTRFNIHTFDELPAGDYDTALSYLLQLAG